MTKRVLSIFIVFLILSMSLIVSSSSAFVGEDRIVIVLDPGHGGVPHDFKTGASARGVNEKDLTLKLANMIKPILEANGSFVVYMTRTYDTTVEVCDRGIFANNVNADFLLSIHFDSSTNSNDSGTTALSSVLSQYEMVNLGNRITSAISSVSGIRNNGVIQRYDNEGYYWNSEKQWDCQDSSLGGLSDYYGIPTWCAKFGIKSLIIEHGYMSNSSDCDYILNDSNLQKIAKAEADAIISYYTNHTHSYGAQTRDFPSNCVFQGKSSEKCTICGHRKNVTLLPEDKDNHYWELSVTVQPKCGSDGSVSRTCRITSNLNEKGHSIENHKDVQVLAAPSQHEYVITENVAVTHAVDGYKKYVCKNCNNYYYEVTKAEGHSFVYVSTNEASCTEDGGNLYRCTKCSAEYSDGIKAYGHDYVLKESKEAECETDGYMTYICSRCNNNKTSIIPKLEHNYVFVSTTDADCEHEGNTTYRCENCGDVKVEMISATGHKIKEERYIAKNIFDTSYTIDSCINGCGYETIEKETPKIIPYAVIACIELVLAGISLTIFCIITNYRKRKTNFTKG